MTSTTQQDSPAHVLIVGAGLAGLFLGTLLEKANIPYDIYERTAEIKPIGAIMSLAATVMPVFEQTDVYNDLLKISKPAALGTFFTDQLDVISVVDPTRADVLGYDRAMFTRPDLYTILYNKIPAHKIHLSQKLDSFFQDEQGVTLIFENNVNPVRGDILVGADGAHSKVREHLYKTLEEQGVLPKEDTKKAVKGYVSLVGTTGPLDPVKFPSLVDPDCETSFIVGDKSTPYSWSTFTIPGNRVCWSVTIQLDASAIEKEQSASSDWLPQENEPLMDKLRYSRSPYGPLGVLFDATPKDQVSRVFLEDKFYETWNHGRTVLIGDAAHKILPSSGQGAVNAIHDATILANRIYDIHPTTTFANIRTALSDYKEERYTIVKDQYAQSHFSAMLLYGQ
ncbi:hypothetical protein BG015_000276, partial [Linnemannia schmuckeri]